MLPSKNYPFDQFPAVPASSLKTSSQRASPRLDSRPVLLTSPVGRYGRLQTVRDPAKREQHQPAAERDVGHAEDLAVRDQARVPREVKVGGATRESTARKADQAGRQAGRQTDRQAAEDK